MRLLLHEIREHHGFWILDDHLAEYHEMIERVAGHVSGRSEINLTPRDYQDVDEDLRGAQAAWAGVEQSEGALRGLVDVAGREPLRPARHSGRWPAPLPRRIAPPWRAPPSGSRAPISIC